MRKITRKVFSIGLVFFILSIRTIHAALYFNRTYQKSMWNGKEAQAVGSFQGYVYVAVCQTTPTPREGEIYRSRQGETWEKMTDQVGIGTFFLAHQNYLYLFSKDPVDNFRVHVFRTTNGRDWVRLDQGNWAIFEDIVSAAPFREHIYFANKSNVYRMNSLGTDIAYETPPAFPSEMKDVRWIVFQDNLFAGGSVIDTTRARSKVYTTTDDTWALSGEFVTDPFDSGSNMDKGFSIYKENGEDRLCWANNSVWIRTLQGRWVQSAATNQSAFVSAPFGYLCYGTRGSKIFTLGSQGRWQEATDAPPGSFKGYAMADETTAFFLFSDLHLLKRGVQQIVSTTADIPPSTVSVGQTNVLIIGSYLNSNFPDYLKSMRVKNKGTTGQEDVAAMYLVRMYPNEEGYSYEYVASFSPSRVNRTEWNLEQPSSIRFEDGEGLIIGVNIASKVIHKKTLLFAVEEAQWTYGDPFLPSVLTGPAEQVIQGTSPEPIDEVIVYPNPAQDTVHFLYDLASPSDVTVRIFDRAGVLISEVTDPNKPAGLRSRTTWNASSRSSGTYFATIKIKPASGDERVHKTKVFIER